MNINFLEYHVILCQCPRFITENILHPAQLLWNLTISCQRSFNLRIMVDSIGKHNFRNIEIDSQTDRDDTAEQEYLPEQIQ